MMIVLREKSERQMEEEGLRMLCKEGHRKSARLDNTLVIIIIVIITIVKTPPWWDFDWWEYAG